MHTILRNVLSRTNKGKDIRFFKQIELTGSVDSNSVDGLRYFPKYFSYLSYCKCSLYFHQEVTSQVNFRIATKEEDM